LQINKKTLDKPQKQKLFERNFNLSELERKIYDTLTTEPQKLSEIADKSGITEQNANIILMKLELKNIICQLPGYLYFKISGRD